VDIEHKKGRLLIGWGSTNITPDRPVQLAGQWYERISEGVMDPITATALALETVGEDGPVEQAIMVSCDLAAIRTGVQPKVKSAVASRLPGFDISKLFLFATHTHTAPVMLEGRWYPAPGPGIMRAEEYVEFLVARLSDAIVEAWEGRKPGGVSRALGYAVLGNNRRIVYLDGHAEMYGRSDRSDFAGLEGSQDHGVEMLFTWNQAGELTGIVPNVCATPQVVMHERRISADAWAQMRAELRKRYGEDLFILPQVSAAGDQCPVDLPRRIRAFTAEEMAQRLANAVDEVFPSAKDDIRTEIVFEHVVEDLALPARLVTDEEYERATVMLAALAAKEPTPGSGDYGHMRAQQIIMERYEQQTDDLKYHLELHVIRLGEVAMATNPFELFLDFGYRIKARSKADQTFIVQLSCDSAGYLPTARAVAGGSYSATVQSNMVGPDGGQVLVNRTVDLIDGMWAAEAG